MIKLLYIFLCLNFALENNHNIVAESDSTRPIALDEVEAIYTYYKK